VRYSLGSSVLLYALEGGLGMNAVAHYPAPLDSSEPSSSSASPSSAHESSASSSSHHPLASAAVMAALARHSPLQAAGAVGIAVQECVKYAEVDVSIGTELVRFWCFGVGAAAVVVGCIVCVLGCPCFMLPGPVRTPPHLSPSPFAPPSSLLLRVRINSVA
jgi:hypothetical protein